MKRLAFGRLLSVWTLVVMTAVCFSGCVYLVVGSVGALGGYIVSPDTVEGTVERDYVDVWDAAVEVVSIMGVIEYKSEQAGSMTAKISGGRVYINVLQYTQKTVKLRVKSRKAFFPRIRNAQEVYVKIMNQLGY